MPLRKSADAMVIQVRSAQGVTGWLEDNGVVEANGQVILYKRVSKEFRTQEGTDYETSWVIGEVKIHPKWNPSADECGPGKFHACSRPYLCDEFRNEDGDRYIAIEVKTKDLYAWPNAQYPHKIAVRECVVLREVDRWGDPIEDADREEVAA